MIKKRCKTCSRVFTGRSITKYCSGECFGTGRYWSNVVKTNNCWNWTGAKDKDGYGRTRKLATKNRVRAHRTSWILENGEIGKGKLVLHRCGNKGCIKPSHLYIGTALDNARDRGLDGKTSRGENHSNAKLTNSAVREIRKSGNAVQLSKKYGVAHRTIRSVLLKKTWKHI